MPEFFGAPAAAFAILAPSGDATGASDVANIQAAVNTLRGSPVPGGTIFLGSGIWYLNKSIDCTNITSNIQSVIPTAGLGNGSLTFQGASTGATRIIARLTAAFPVLDFTGSSFVTLRDLTITGLATGAQSCAVLAARSNTANLGDHFQMQRVHIDGTYSLVAYANVSSDQSVNRDCQLNSGNGAPRALVVDQTDILGVGSAYQTFASTTANTFHEFDNCSFSSGSSSAILYGKGSSLLLHNSFFALSGTATYCVEIHASGDTNQFHSIYAFNVRAEATSGPGFLLIPAGGYKSLNGYISGVLDMPAAGVLVQFGDATGLFGEYFVNVIFNASAGAWFGGGGLLRNNMISTVGGTSNLGIGSVANASYGNLVLQGSNTPWTFPDTSQPNLQIGSLGLTLGGTIGVGNGTSANLTALAIGTGSGPASDVVVQWLKETIHGATYWIPLFQ